MASLLLFIPWFQQQPIVIIGGSSPIRFGPVLAAEPFGDGTGFPLVPFGVLVATGVILGFRLAEWRGRETGMHPRLVFDLASWAVIPGFIAAHVLDVVFYHPEKILENPLVLVNPREGLSSFGGFFGAIGGALYWRYTRKASLLRVGDAIVWAFPLSWIFGRLGCFVAHDHPGSETDFPLAVADYYVSPLVPRVPRHDLGLYEAIWSVAVMALFWAMRKKKLPAGFYMGFLPVLYAPFRFFLDYLRAKPEDIGADADARYFGLTPGQYGAILLFLIGIAAIVRVYKAPVPELPEEYRWDASKAASGTGTPTKPKKKRT